MKLKLIIILLLLLSVRSAFSQPPCTDETAYQTTGKWSVMEDDLAMADASFPKTHFQTVLPKAQKAIELIQKVAPTLAGVEARTYRTIRGRSYTSNGAVPFGARLGFFGYYCVPDTPSFPSIRGQVRLGGESDTWIEVFFNSFGWLINEKSSLGKELLTVDGEMIYFFPNKMGKVKGFDLLQPNLFRDRKNEAVIIVPDNRTPFKILSRKDFLLARIRYYEVKTKTAQNSLATEYQDYIDKFNRMLSEMQSAEQQLPAIVLNSFARPGKEKIFVEESTGGRRLFIVDRSFFSPNLPRHAVRFITVYWCWNDKNPPKAAIIRQFKENFDFQALKMMLEK